LVGTPEGEAPFGRRRLRWEDIRLDLREIGWEVVKWIYLVQGRDQWQAVVNIVMHFWVT
jgi:hypothetical protein